MVGIMIELSRLFMFDKYEAYMFNFNSVLNSSTPIKLNRFINKNWYIKIVGLIEIADVSLWLKYHYKEKIKLQKIKRDLLLQILSKSGTYF